LILLISNIIKVVKRAPKNEKKDKENLKIISKPKNSDSVTKKLAPDEIPKRNGSARGFKKSVWESNPAIESEAPTKKDERTLGSLIFKRSSSPFFGFIKNFIISNIEYLFEP